MTMLRVHAAFEPAGKRPRSAARPALRHWSVRHARFLEIIYMGLERALLAGASLFKRIGFERLEQPIASIERSIKGALFDCRMCGQCILSSTGMSCPMNCPKGLRNGPCGGVRADGNCEVYPEMPCVWVKAWEGSQLMRGGERIQYSQSPIDHRLKGRSSWLAVSRGERAVDKPRAGS
ncbi:Methylene-tetrahydrofolate reductase C terminal [Rhizobiales bacterium GAS113]|nr:Methylene-tetrahydrofolate reductase C terminal [Rhizobiales bacterium GAS113]